MAEEAQFLNNGAAAYDVYSVQLNSLRASSAAPEYQPQQLPEERPAPQKVTRVKAKTAIAPFTLFGMAAVACLLVLVVFGYVQLFEATSRVSKLEYRLQDLVEQQAVLQSKYAERIDLDNVKLRAGELGLKTPSADQIVYVNLTGGDRAEIYQQEKSSLLGEIAGAMQESISELIAYLHPAAA